MTTERDLQSQFTGPDSKSAAVPLADYQRVVRERDEMAQKVAALADRCNELQAWRERTEAYDRIPSQQLSPKAIRLARRLDTCAALWRTEGQSGPRAVDVGKLASEIGYGWKATRAAFDELAAVGHCRLTDAEPVMKRTKRGTIEITPVMVEVLDVQPAELGRADGGRGHGGARCATCSGGGVTTGDPETWRQAIERTTTRTPVYCTGCGTLRHTITTHTDRPLTQPQRIGGNGAKSPDPHSFQDETSQPDEPDPHSFQDETSQPDEPAARPEDHSFQDETSSSDEPDPHSFQLDHVEVNQGVGAPPPQVAGTPLEDPAAAACPTGPGWAALLAQIAGDGDSHVRMQPAGEDKYLTCKGAVTADLARRHIAGDILIGARLRHAGGMTRALIWEGETPEAFAQLRHGAALKLAQSGALPILEDSPSLQHPGSGKLWLIFDGLVDARAALATALHHAPELAACTEHWPNGGKAVSLPGGFYVHDGVDRWRAVWEPGGIHRTGPDAFALLVRCQTPAAWVTERRGSPTVEASAPDRAPSKGHAPCAWIPPTRSLQNGRRDGELTRYAMAMAGKCGMSEGEIFAELCRIRDELCEQVPDDPITDGALWDKARSAVRKDGAPPGLQTDG
jgi:hypothetical protein